jgi:arylsulfatase A-like enzyme
MLTQTLDELGIAANTIVIFSSDNGGYGSATDMAPLRGSKGTYYEGGIRVPFFVKWPGFVRPGSTCAQPITGVDFLPTLCEMTGSELPANQPLDGVSLVSLCQEKTQSLGARALYWHFPAYLQANARDGRESRDPLFRTRPCSIVRLGDWKLHHYFEDNGLELYNLQDDIGETNDLSAKLPIKTQELLGQLDSWREMIAAPIPTDANPKFDATAEAAAIQAAQQRARADRSQRRKKKS